MALGEPGLEGRDMGMKEMVDVTDMVDSAFYFKELLKDLRGYQTTDPNQRVKMVDKEYKMEDLIKGFEVFSEYVTENQDFLKEDPDRIRNYLDGAFPATRILAEDKNLQDAAVALARKELGLAGEGLSM